MRANHVPGSKKPESPLGKATPGQQDTLATSYSVWKAPEEMEVGGSAWNHTPEEKAIRVKSLRRLQGPPAPTVVSEVLYDMRKQT